jgi:hypothetical protein
MARQARSPSYRTKMLLCDYSVFSVLKVFSRWPELIPPLNANILKTLPDDLELTSS